MVKNCTECGNNDRCLQMIREGTVVYCGSTLCKPIQKEETEMLKKAMLSQPMAGKTDAEIIATREKAIAALKARGYEVVNTLFTDDWYKKDAMESRGVVQIPLCFLAKSLENMSLCHAAYFCKGWEKARGCKIEHDAAVAYGLEIIYEEE
jgi:hypothetical protein